MKTMVPAVKSLNNCVHHLLKRCPETVRHWLGIHYTGPEKRLHQRRLTQDRMTFQFEYVHLKQSGRKRETRLHDISEGGICFVADYPVAREMIMQTTIYISEIDLELPVLARTIWTRSVRKGDRNLFYIGAAFLDIDKPNRREIRRYVELENSLN